MTTPTPPKQQTESVTANANALAFADQLEDYVAGLKKELRGYGDPNTIGRDAGRLRTFFQNIHQCELQIAQAMGVSWSPQNST